MERIDYFLSLSSLPGDPAFSEASREELRVLLTLVSLEGKSDSDSALASISGVSLARCRAALVFWEDAGFIKKRSEGGIIEEFEERLVRGEIDEEPAVRVADHIRQENLSSMLHECTRLLGQSCLSNVEVKHLTALNSQYGLSPEFIVTLAAHLESRDALTVKKLCNKAIDLEKAGIDDLDKLEEYITNSENPAIWEFRRLIGIYGRNLSPTERQLFTKWSDEFGYSVSIVGEAYDIAVLNTGKGNLAYMDKVLSAWHEAGCKTLSDCQSASNVERAKRAASGTKKKSAKTTPETPRYGDFDINDAFKKALERSYGESED